MAIKPTSDWVWIRPEPPAREVRGILIPASIYPKKPIYRGTVVAVGPGKFVRGVRQPMYSRPGMSVIYFNELVDESNPKGDRILKNDNWGNLLEVTVNGEKLVMVPDDWVWVEVCE